MAKKTLTEQLREKEAELAELQKKLGGAEKEKPKPEPEPDGGKKPPAKPAYLKAQLVPILGALAFMAIVLAIWWFGFHEKGTESVRPGSPTLSEQIKSTKAELATAEKEKAEKEELANLKAKLSEARGESAESQPASTSAALAPAPSASALEVAPTPDQPPTIDRMPGMPGTVLSEPIRQSEQVAQVQVSAVPPFFSLLENFYFDGTAAWGEPAVIAAQGNADAARTVAQAQLDVVGRVAADDRAMETQRSLQELKEEIERITVEKSALEAKLTQPGVSPQQMDDYRKEVVLLKEELEKLHKLLESKTTANP